MSEVLQPTIVKGIKCYSPEEAERYADYPDDGFDVTDRLEADSFWVRSRNRLLKKIISTQAKRFPEPRFLEIGCGTGAFIEELARDNNLQITGSEIYLGGLHYAKRRLPDVEFIQFDAKQGILPEKFEIIAAFDVIEHIDDDITAISNIHRMLSDDGCFIVTVPQHMFLWSRLDEIVMHKRRYSRKELVSKLQEQGFTIGLCSSFLFVLFPFMAVARLLDRPTKGQPSSDAGFEKRVGFPKVINWIFDKVMRIDEALIERGVSLPFGGSLLVVAHKGKAP